jgi:hypothetical protein
MYGSPASLTSIAGGGTNTGATALSMTGNVVEATIVTEIVVATPPTTPISIIYQVSLDGTNYLQDGPVISFTPAAAGTFWYTYYPPDSAQGAQVLINNGATNAITAMIQGSTLAVS